MSKIAFQSPAGFALGYHVVREAWYSQVAPIPDDHTVLTIGLFSFRGGGKWEFAIDDEPFGLRVKVFTDAWQAFDAIPEFFTGLADLGAGASLAEVVELMDSLGFHDFTKRENPHSPVTAG